MTFYVVEVCRECGNLKTVCSDPTLPWYPQRAYCYASAAREQVWRRTHEVFGQPKPTSPAPHVTDGLAWWMSLHDLTPDDHFFGELTVGGFQQPLGDEPESSQHHPDRDNTQ